MRCIENSSIWKLLTDVLESGRFRSCAKAVLPDEKPNPGAMWEKAEDRIKSQIMRLACFTSGGINKKEETLAKEKTEHELFQMERDGKIFGSNIFIRLWRHYFLKTKFEETDCGDECELCHTLHDYLGNCWFFEANQDVVTQLFAWGAQLTPCLTREQCEMLEPKLVRKAKAADYLRASGVELTLSCGSFTAKDNLEIFRMIERRIETVTGNRMIERLFNDPDLRERFPYIAVIDRLLIDRPIDDGQDDMPFALLLNLAAKHLSFTHKQTPREDAEAKRIEDEAIELAKAWICMMDITGDSGIEYASMGVDRFPEYVMAGMLYDKLCVPAQYSRRFILLLLDYLICPWFDKAETEYSYRQYRKAAEYILDAKKYGAPLSVEELHNGAGIGRKTCQKLLRDLSIPFHAVNKDYNTPNAPTNLWRYPVICFPEGNYLCLDQHFCGIGFFLTAIRMIKAKYPVLDRKQGESVEKILRDEIRKRGVRFLDGKYAAAAGCPEGQIDTAINGKNTFLIEIKKSSCFEEFDEVDDVALFGALGKGMVNAQKQCFAHEYYLRKVGRIRLDNGGELTADKKKTPVFKLSACLSEYSFLTSKPFTQSLMKTLFVGEVKAEDESRDNELSQLLELSKKIRELAEKQPDGKLDIRTQSFYSMFCSLQQLLTVIWLSKSADEVEKYLLNLAYTSDRTLDPYLIILTTYYHLAHDSKDASHQQIVDLLAEKGIPVLYGGI